jgi:modulator of FtsH protease
MSGWDSFFVAQVGASAAVAGLVFVGVSINLDKILKYAGLPGRTLEALVVLILVLVTASLMLVPRQPDTLIGAEVLAAGALGWIWVVALEALNLRELEPQHRGWWILRVVLSQLATLPFIIAGAVTVARGSGGLYWLVPGVIFCFLVAFFDAWVLLIEINR